MSLATLYEEKRSAFAPPTTQTVYEQTVFNLERQGEDNLVQKYEEETIFRPPLVPSSYVARLFAEGQISQL